MGGLEAGGAGPEAEQARQHRDVLVRGHPRELVREEGVAEGRELLREHIQVAVPFSACWAAGWAAG